MRFIVLLLALFVCLGFTTQATAQGPQGEAFTSVIQPQTGHTKINLSADSNIKVLSVVKEENGVYVPVDSALWASNPSDPDKKPVLTFVNEFTSGEKYKVKYEWYASTAPTVTHTTS
jgi:hypothetical protein